jgi:hypothetical protein
MSNHELGQIFQENKRKSETEVPCNSIKNTNKGEKKIDFIGWEM